MDAEALAMPSALTATAALVLVALGGAAATHFVLRHRHGLSRVLLCIVIMTGLFIAPWLLPTEIHYGHRYSITLFFIVYAWHTLDVALETYPQPTMHRTFSRFLAYYMSGTDVRLILTDADRSKARWDLLRRAGAMVEHLLVFCAGQWLLQTYPELRDYRLAYNFWLGVVFYCYFAANCEFAMLFVGVLSGCVLSDYFHHPLFAANPREFWSQRWNMSFRDLSHRTVFLPLKRRWGINKFVCVLLIFLVSGLVHEYTLLAAVRSPDLYWPLAGGMMLYFLLHAVGSLLYGLAWRLHGRKGFLPRPLAVLTHALWITLLAPVWFRSHLLCFPLDNATEMRDFAVFGNATNRQLTDVDIRPVIGFH